METVILSIAIFALMMVFLGIGLIFKRRCLRGTCSHAAEAIKSPHGDSLMCPRCEREVADKQQASDGEQEDR